MTKLVWAFLSILAGAALGLGLTAFAVEVSPSFAVFEAGSWNGRARIGSPDADPYSRAFLAARGEIPMGAAEGMALTARRDTAGRSLDRRCSYTLAGPFPAARYWTLAVYNGDGTRAGKSDGATNGRAHLTSSEALRNQKGDVSVAIAPGPQPGNWLVPPKAEGLLAQQGFEIVLRLYDTQVSTNVFALDAATLPRITREACP